MPHQEKLPTRTHEATPAPAIETSSTDHHERLRRDLDDAEAKHKEKQEKLELAQREAHERADSLKHVAKPEKPPAQKRSQILTKQQRDASFNRQMNIVYDELRPSERRFSRFIHNRAVESVSNGLGATIARPNALLAGSVCAFLLVTAVYSIAKYYGYQLSGFETIGAFALGWILGIIYDYFKLLVTGKSSS